MRGEFVPYAIAFRVPVATGAGPWTVRRGAWLRLADREGLEGLGEAAPLEPLANDEEAALAVECEPWRAGALDLARLDLEGRRAGRPLAAAWGGAVRPGVACNALVTATGVEATVTQASALAAQGYGTIKLKVGVASPDTDIARVAQVRHVVGPAMRLRIDANGAWDEATAIRVLRAIAPHDIEYAEDPVEGDCPALGRTGVPIALDARTREAGWAAVRARRVHALVLKPMALGGPTPTRELAVAAIEAGLIVTITSCFDTPVGIAGALHLAASLPGPEGAHGLATADLLGETPLEGLPRVAGGRLALPAGPGLGVRFPARTA
ncbi:MAG: o-succinylbenzoate synthase [Betaproteobacteria bacterium]|nr:o-succinylbenzoate synthase [Betaproteobacteria bacterium]